MRVKDLYNPVVVTADADVTRATKVGRGTRCLPRPNR